MGSSGYVFNAVIFLPAFTSNVGKNSVFCNYKISIDLTDLITECNIVESSYSWNGALFSNQMATYNRMMAINKNRGFLGLVSLSSGLVKEPAFISNYTVIEIYKR